jgi:hypothetical protein
MLYTLVISFPYALCVVVTPWSLDQDNLVLIDTFIFRVEGINFHVAGIKCVEGIIQYIEGVNQYKFPTCDDKRVFTDSDDDDTYRKHR